MITVKKLESAIIDTSATLRELFYDSRDHGRDLKEVSDRVIEVTGSLRDLALKFQGQEELER